MLVMSSNLNPMGDITMGTGGRGVERLEDEAGELVECSWCRGRIVVYRRCCVCVAGLMFCFRVFWERECPGYETWKLNWTKSRAERLSLGRTHVARE